MRLFIALLIMSCSSVVLASEQRDCNATKVAEDAKAVGAAAVNGQPIEYTPCLLKQSKPIARKPAPPKAGVPAKPQANAETESQQMMSTVVSPIIIVTGSHPSQQADQVKQQPKKVIVYRDSPPIIKRVRVVQPRKKNAILIMGGVGPTGNHADVNNTQVKITTEHSAVIGLQYQRSVNDRYLLGVSILSNTTATLNVGVEF